VSSAKDLRPTNKIPVAQPRSSVSENEGPPIKIQQHMTKHAYRGADGSPKGQFTRQILGALLAENRLAIVEGP
jgi:hypothetical protein